MFNGRGKLTKIHALEPGDLRNTKENPLKLPDQYNSEDKTICVLASLAKFELSTTKTTDQLEFSGCISEHGEKDSAYVKAIRINDLFAKHRMVRQTEGFLILVNLLLSQTVLEYIILDSTHDSSALRSVSIVITVLQLTIVGLHIVGFCLNSRLIQLRLSVDSAVKRPKWQVYFSQCLVVLLLSIHPFFLSFNVPVQFITEAYYTTKAHCYYFHRNLVDYLILAHFMVNYFAAIQIWIESSVYLSNQYHRITGMFGIRADVTQCLKSTMNSQQIAFSVTAIALGVVFFTVVFRITEIFYINNSNFLDFDNSKLIDSFSSFFVSFWFSIVTMTTVGYGDFVVRSQLSRLFVYFAGLYGVLNNSMAVVAFMNFFSMNNQEDTCLTLIERIDYAEEKTQHAARSIQFLWKAYRSKALGKKNQLKNSIFEMMESLSKFTDCRNKHANTLSANSRYEYLSFAAEKLLAKSESILESIRKRIPNEKDGAANAIKNKSIMLH